MVVSLIPLSEDTLSKFQGKVLLIVNAASRCAYSRQIADLEQLYIRYRKQGFEILGFPCNQFNEKEPGSHAEVHECYEDRLGSTFSLFEKVEVAVRQPNRYSLILHIGHHSKALKLKLRTGNG